MADRADKTSNVKFCTEVILRFDKETKTPSVFSQFGEKKGTFGTPSNFLDGAALFRPDECDFGNLSSIMV